MSQIMASNAPSGFEQPTGHSTTSQIPGIVSRRLLMTPLELCSNIEFHFLYDSHALRHQAASDDVYREPSRRSDYDTASDDSVRLHGI